MENFTVNANLIVQKSPGVLPEYYIHIVTKTDKSDYRAKGYSSFSGQSSSEENFILEVIVERVENIPDFSLPTPVVHTIYLGALPFGENDGIIQVNVVEAANMMNTEPKKKIGETTASTVDATEDSRPIPEIS